MTSQVSPDAASGTPGDVVLRFDHVSRIFGAFAAVEEIDLELHRGEILTLLGPSGCGKTTTLRMAIGLERADRGRITYRGATVDAPGEKIFVSPEHRDMGMVFQSYAIWPHMNVFENVAFPLRTRKIEKSVVATKVKEFLEVVGLKGFEQRSGMQLSGGQQQRVAVARGLVANPDVLLMDEPFSNLDAKLRDQMRVELKLLQRRIGASILFVTHDQSEAMAISDRIAVMRAGKVEQIGSPLELYTKPVVPFVRDFLGHTLKLPGRVVGREGANVRVDIGHGVTLDVGGMNHMKSAAAGADCLVTIRPEEINVVDQSVEAGANSVSAGIRTLLFLGQQYEAVVDLAGGRDLLIFLPRLVGWREGQGVRLQFPAERLQVWDAE